MSKAFINVLKAYGAPLTREEYLNTAYAGKPPSDTSEIEDEFPEDDVRFMKFRPTTHEEVKAEEDEKKAKEAEKKAKKKK